MPPLAEKTLAPEATTDLIAQAEELKRFSLEELAELFSFDLEAAALLLTPFAAFFGIDLDLDTTNTHFNPAETNQVSTEFGHCDAPSTAPAGAVENTTDLQKPLGEGEVEDLDSPPQGPLTPAEAAELESYLGMNCYQIGSLHSGKMSLLRNGQAGNPGKIERSLDLLEIAAKEKGCHL